MKCDTCKFKKTHIGAGPPDDYSMEYCEKDHWMGGPIDEEVDEVEMSNTIHDPATWVPAANTVGQEAPDPAYVSHRKYRRLV